MAELKKIPRFQDLEWLVDANGTSRVTLEHESGQWHFALHKPNAEKQYGWHLSQHSKGAYASGHERSKAMALWRLEMVFKALSAT